MKKILVLCALSAGSTALYGAGAYPILYDGGGHSKIAPPCNELINAIKRETDIKGLAEYAPNLEVLRPYYAMVQTEKKKLSSAIGRNRDNPRFRRAEFQNALEIAQELERSFENRCRAIDNNDAGLHALAVGSSLEAEASSGSTEIEDPCAQINAIAHEMRVNGVWYRDDVEYYARKKELLNYLNRVRCAQHDLTIRLVYMDQDYMRTVGHNALVLAEDLTLLLQHELIKKLNVDRQFLASLFEPGSASPVSYLIEDKCFVPHLWQINFDLNNNTNLERDLACLQQLTRMYGGLRRYYNELYAMFCCRSLPVEYSRYAQVGPYLQKIQARIQQNREKID